MGIAKPRVESQRLLYTSSYFDFGNIGSEQPKIQISKP